MIIPSSINFFGLNIHIYGLIIGLAIVLGVSLSERQYKKFKYSEECFWKVGLVGLIFGVFGARIWHVLTDYYLYTNNFFGIFSIWNGGMSIFGGIVGGVVGIKIALIFFRDCKKIKFLEVLDLAVFGLPFAQVVGRLGNYVNQELYGLPSKSFLKIFIAPERRLVGFENIEYYHPLFLYEMILMSIFGAMIYYLNYKEKLPKIGSGKLFLYYGLYYSISRFALDFMRIGDPGINRVVLLFVIVILGYILLKTKKR